MSQLALNIATRLSYAPENFLVHRGVAEALTAAGGLAALPGFRILYIQGGPRSGKTHFSIKLVDELLTRGVRPRLIDAERFSSEGYPLREGAFGADDFFIIDDIDRYLARLLPGGSGEFVSFIERLRVARAALVLFSKCEVGDFQFDNHVRSRLVPAMGPVLGLPDEDDLPELLKLMARQRGFSLQERQINFLLKRLGKSVAAMEKYLDRLISLTKVRAQPVRFPLLGDAI